VLHIAAWDEAVNLRIVANKPVSLKGDKNFPPVRDESKAAWKKALVHLKKTHAALIKTVAALSDSRLQDRVPDKDYNVYFMLHGVTQHELYHAGQIALLKKSRL
jgi:hypothetical protein